MLIVKMVLRVLLLKLSSKKINKSKQDKYEE